MFDAATIAEASRGLDLDLLTIEEVQAEFQRLLVNPAELIAKRQDLQRKTSHTMGDRNRLLYRLISSPRLVEPITPPGQFVPEVFNHRSDDSRQPYIGLTVNYRTRHGEGRSGRTEFPALVLKVRTGGILELLVIYGPEDLKEVIAPKATAENPRGAWAFMNGDALDKVTILEAQVAALRAEIEDLKASVGKNGRNK